VKLRVVDDVVMQVQRLSRRSGQQDRVLLSTALYSSRLRHLV